VEIFFNACLGFSLAMPASTGIPLRFPVDSVAGAVVVFDYGREPTKNNQSPYTLDKRNHVSPGMNPGL